MISTKNRHLLPDRKILQKICKSISVLDAILSQEWESRFFSYNSKWAENEEFCEIRNGSGDHTLILFKEEGCVINGFVMHTKEPNKGDLTNNLPSIFNEFIFGEPVNTIGTTYCLWTTELDSWEIGKVDNFDDDSHDFLFFFDNNPETYLEWATDYFDECYKESGIPIKTVTEIYERKPLTKKMVLSIVEELEDWDQLIEDLNEINYPHKIKSTN